MKIKLWVDDVRQAPEGYTWVRSVNEAIAAIKNNEIEVIDIDHDAGNFAFDGGDYIKLLDWLEEEGLSYPIHIHSMNPIGRANMQRIIRHNNWKEV